MFFLLLAAQTVDGNELQCQVNILCAVHLLPLSLLHLLFFSFLSSFPFHLSSPSLCHFSHCPSPPFPLLPPPPPSLPSLSSSLLSLFSLSLLTTQVNYLSHVLLTLELLPLLLETAATTSDGRIIFLSSAAHTYSSWNPANITSVTEEQYSRTKFYCHSKLYTVWTHIYTCIHTCIHTYMRTHIHTYIKSA